jgi:hypothetical protein
MKKQLNENQIVSMDWVKFMMDDPIAYPNDTLELESMQRHIAPTEYGKVFYMVYNGMLRQFKIKYSLLFPFNFSFKEPNAPMLSRAQLRGVSIIEVAGIGEMAVMSQTYGCIFNFETYKSVEDFKNGKPYELANSSYSIEEMKEVFSNYLSFKGSKAIRYKWNGTSAEIVYITDFPLFLVYDPLTFGLESMPQIPNKAKVDKLLQTKHAYKNSYAAKEECERDNQILVACFDDEPKDTEKGTQERIEIFMLGMRYTTTKDKLDKVMNILTK